MEGPLSTQIGTAFVQQYKTNVMYLSQQRGSRLRKAVRVEMVQGESAYFDRLGTTTARKRTTRHGDTPVMDTPHSRRKLDLKDYEWADLIDKQDEVRLLADPKSTYAQAGAWAMGRAMDDVIIAAANGTAKTGKDGAGSQALPSDQQIAVGASGLTKAKLIEASEIFNINDVDPEEPKYMAIGPKQVSDMLNDTTITSADYNQIKLLYDGKVVHFMGFDFILSNRLDVDGSGDRLCLAFTKQAMVLGIGEDIRTRITERDDKSYATQVYLCMTLGAVRMEEEQVVEVACQEG